VCVCVCVCVFPLAFFSLGGGEGGGGREIFGELMITLQPDDLVEEPTCSS
jgi:hypothetical protein